MKKLQSPIPEEIAIKICREIRKKIKIKDGEKKNVA